MDSNVASDGLVRGATHGNVPFSRYVAARDTIYVSGIVGRHPVTRELVRDDMGEQARVALRVIGSILEEAGAALTDVLKASIFVTDMTRLRGREHGVSRGLWGGGGGYRPKVDLCASFLDPSAQYEDHFTGSACGAMAALAARNGVVRRDHAVVEQAAGVGWIGHADIDLHDVGHRVLVGGAAVLVLSGTIEALPIHGSGDSIQGGST